MLKELTRPFSKRIEKYKKKVHGFADPIKESIANLRGKLPSAKAFAGSEELADAPPEGAVEKTAEKGAKLGLMDRLKNFKHSINEMSDLQKLILLAIAICLPAGILIATVLVKIIKGRKNK